MRSFPRVVLVLVVLVVSAGLVFAEKTCPNCGASNPDNAKFCKNCGAKLPEAQPSRPAAPKVTGSVSVNGPVVNITSEPSGATVAVDGRNRGKTPLELSDLGPGRHEVELARSGYRTFYGDFTIAGLFGSIVVTTEPVGAEVLLDGESKGRAPDSGLTLTRVPYGRRTVTTRLQGYNDVVKTVDLKSAGPIGVSFRLGYGKGFLRVESEPASVNLFVNSQTAGKTPYAAELVPARYTLTLSRRGYYDWVGYADVQYSESTAVRAVLDRMQTRKLPFLILAIAGFGAGAGSAVMGESEYAKYKAATTPDDAKRLRRSTGTWDLRRDVAFGVGAILTGLYVVVKW
jgi:hypothetical protein